MNSLIPILINKFQHMYWFILRPHTKGVKALIFKNKKVLMVRLTYYPNTWTFPGGGVEHSETTEQAIIRECFEEVGINLKNPIYIGDMYFTHEYKKDTLSIFTVDIESEHVVIDTKEIAEAKWFELNNLPTMGQNAKSILEFFLKNKTLS